MEPRDIVDQNEFSVRYWDMEEPTPNGSAPYSSNNNDSDDFISDNSKHGSLTPAAKMARLSLPTHGDVIRRRSTMTQAEIVKATRARSRDKWREAFYDFCNSTTFHGLRQVVEHQPYVTRRIFWLTLVLTGIALFLYQMTTGVLLYLSYPTSVNIKIHHNSSIRVPAVTICNQNAFRKTVAVNHDWYRLLFETFSTDGVLDDDVIKTTNFSEVTVYDIYNTTGHAFEDMIVSCTWLGSPCQPDDFAMTMTDNGKCYTFNSRRPRQTSRTGTEGGLSLLVNVQQYEYMPGPNKGAGLRVLVHTPGDVALVRDFGIAVPPGSNTLIGASLVKLTNLPDPHGTCDDSITLDYYNHYSKINCIENCKQLFVEDLCQCRTKQMAGTTNEIFNTKGKADCHCPIPCHHDEYEIVNSYGDISHYDALNLLTSNLTGALQKEYTMSQEIDQRVNANIADADRRKIQALAGAVNSTEWALAEILHGLDHTQLLLTDLFDVLGKRLHFHKTLGLDKVLYTMEHDFVRGWSILEERTLPYFTVNYLDLRDGFRRIINTINGTRGGTADEQILSRSLWINLKNTFEERLNMASRIRLNVTEVHESYKTGEPLIRFKVTKDRRYDMSWITVQLLQAIVDDGNHRQDFFYETLMKRIDMVIDTINKYISMGDNFTETYEIDHDLWLSVDSDFRYSCQSYNYYIFLYKTRIVHGPLIFANEFIDEFVRLNRSLYEAKADVNLTLKDLSKLIKTGRSDRKDIKDILKLGLEYIDVKTRRKLELAEQFSARHMADVMNGLTLFYADLRSHARSLQEKLKILAIATKAVWANMLMEYSTAQFYGKVREDFVASANDTAFYLPYFADLLDVSVDSIANTSRSELEYRLNADFNVTSLEDKLEEVSDFYDRLSDLTDISDILGNEDELLTSSLTEYREGLTDFQKQTRIDTDFYLTNFIQMDFYMKELSYQEIIQQPAYDMLNLLGDIGGSIGLFLGASALTVIEVLDMMFMQLVRLSKI